MSDILIPSTYNYIAVFLTFNCNLACSCCINAYTGINRKREQLLGEEWVWALSRIVGRQDLPITIGGGEPTLHKDFYAIVNALHEAKLKSKIRSDLDLLTNARFNITEFMGCVSPEIFKRSAPYASIRVSYHPETMYKDIIIAKVRTLLDNGYRVGIWSVNHPHTQHHLSGFGKECDYRGIDFRLKEFLGMSHGKMYGTYKYEHSCDGKQYNKKVLCKTSELIIGPEGNVYRCHADLYEQREPIGNIMDEKFVIEDIYRPCGRYGECNPCDVKVKFDRYQIMGHTSVDITEVIC